MSANGNGPEEIDWGMLATEAAELHVQRCFDALEACEDEDVDPETVDDPACAPFCGCDVCVRRETIFAVWNIIAEATRAGVEMDGPDDEESAEADSSSPDD